jgi:hypothetical protein
VDQNARRGPVIVRRVDVAAIETARMEKGLTRPQLCLAAKIDPCAYRSLLRHQGVRSRDTVILAVLRALGLKIKDIVSFTPCEEPA